MVLARGSSISCAVLSLQTQVLVDPELAGARVAGSEDGKSDDDSERPKFGRDLSELSQTLGDSVASLVFGRRSTHHASRGLHSHDLSGIHIGQMSGGEVEGRLVSSMRTLFFSWLWSDWMRF